MLHKLLITKLLNNLVLPSIRSYTPSQQGQKPMMKSLCTPEILYRREVHRLKYYCCSLQRGNRTGQFLWILVARRRYKTGEATPGDRAPALPLTFRTTYFTVEPGGRGSVSSSSVLAPKAVFGVWSPFHRKAGWRQWMEFFDLNQEDRREGNELSHSQSVHSILQMQFDRFH